MATMHNLLSKTHFENRYRLYIKTVIHHLLENIYAAWNENKIAYFFIIDVSTIYPNIFY